MMNFNNGVGLFSIILGLLFIVLPMFSSELVSIIVGLSLLFFGISTAFMGYNMRHSSQVFSKATLIIGFISVILGFLFIFYLDALSFLISLDFYIVGFIMMIFGLAGLFSKTRHGSAFTFLLVLIMGIIAITLAMFAMTQPLYIAIIIGSVLIIEGVTFMLN